MNKLPPTSTHHVEGISFSVPELMLLRAWAEFHDLRMRIDLDWHVDDTTYEEIVTLNRSGCASPRWLLWRTADNIVLQPVIGRAHRFETITDVLGAICPEQV